MDYYEIIHSEGFKNWFGDWSKAFDEAGLDFKHTAWKNVSKAVDSSGMPLRLYHGTTHEWTKYSRKLGNHENDMGIGFYATSDRGDAESNYLKEGSDITSKTAFFAENLAEKKGISTQKARKIINEKFVGDTEIIMEVFLKIKRPVIITTKGFEGTSFDFAPTFDDENYEDSKTLIKFKEAFDDVCDDFDLSYDIKIRAWEAFMENIGELDYTSAYKIIKSIKSIEFLYDYLQNEELGGNNVYEFVSQVFQKLRFDGVIYIDASEHFNMNMRKGTRHFVAFKPNQIKLADGANTTFDSKNTDIRFNDGGGIENIEPIYEWWFKDATNKTEKKLDKQYGITQTMIDFYGGRLYKKRVSIPTTHNDWIPIVRKPIYTAVFVDKDELINKYEPIHKNIFYHHSTIEFKPQDITDFPTGQEVKLNIVGRLTTENVDVLIVINPLSKKKHPHITLSTAEGIHPMQSDIEIEENLEKIVPLSDSIEGICSIFYVENNDKPDLKLSNGGQLETTVAERFNLPVPKNIDDVEIGVDEIISQYANRKMASIQIHSYLNENKDLGLEFIKNHNLTNVHELNKYLNNRQSVLRRPILAERKAESNEFEKVKAEVNTDAIVKMAIEQGEQMEKAINRNDN